ncbi:hypothetical protein LQE85_08675 [Stenotrophomonas rhizophila]|uniref:hypothetical protein n=1 Tax=Stenotrophomonas rhizophila TaxID=216778 RepID=UPI00201CCE90|nr:hypothetical protein [Stenotrophomonas rhizophila]UQY89255.1 hypothetical protein LQE85_08675 [Stenotrophomonas rhizophila]
MTIVYGARAAHLRKVLEASPSEQLTLHARLGAADIGQADERRHILNTPPVLVRCGFVCKVGMGGTATYQGTGKSKSASKAPAELAESKRQRNAHRTPATTARTRAARVAQQAANTLAPAKAEAAESGETVEQFQARGGHIEVLPSIRNREAA